MNEPTSQQSEPQGPEPTPEEIARARMNRPYPRLFVTSEEVQNMLRALEAEKARNPAFGPAELKPFLHRYRAARPTHYRLADGTVGTFMPDEPS
jgi:hypothetical protein